jgi:glycosyltransferase involved in cell wall biosynthesis
VPTGFGSNTTVPTISAVIITQDEARNIAECLDSLAFCDEIIVVDSGSTDGTVDIARQRRARVEHRAFSGFGPQKQYALSLATGDWVLSIDADERVSPALAEEIRRSVADPKFDSFEIPRLSSFCGREMRHSGWYPDHVLRLFRRGQARFSDHLVHERVVPGGRVGRLRELLMHHPVLRLEDALARMDRYSTLGANSSVASGRRVMFVSGILHGSWAFFRAYVLRAGFLDGAEGFLLAVATAEGSYYRYMKAWMMTRHARRSAAKPGRTP